MVTQEVLLLSSIIESMKDRIVTTTDIPRAFLNDYMEVTVLVRLYGLLAQMIMKLDPEKYGDKVIIEMGEKVIYTVLKCALYGVIIGSLLLSRDLFS